MSAAVSEQLPNEESLEAYAMNKLYRASNIAAASIVLSLMSPLAHTSEESLNKVWTIDFSGPPPFKRIFKNTPTTNDSAALPSAAKKESSLRWLIDFSGRPPFKRRSKESLALEEQNSGSVAASSTQKARSFRPRSRYKRHR